MSKTEAKSVVGTEYVTLRVGQRQDKMQMSYRKRPVVQLKSSLYLSFMRDFGSSMLLASRLVVAVMQLLAKEGLSEESRQRGRRRDKKPR